MHIEKYSIGIGDRFGREGIAQLRAVQAAEALGVLVVPVWNKSRREHSLIGTRPADVRAAGDVAVQAAGWRHPYYVDADHIGVETVDAFIESSDFFTLDVADFIGVPVPDAVAGAFVRDMAPFRGALHLPGVGAPFDVTDAVLHDVALRYLRAAAEAGKTYRRILASKAAEGFVAEVSLDEALSPQTPLELFFILGALAREHVPVQTIAPKFCGKFLKGVDYVGDLDAFAREFEVDLAVIRHAVEVFGLPSSLKISVHTGSDKFSIYPIIRRALRSSGAGLHLKTAGTTWLEEIVGVALSGDRGLGIAKQVYAQAFHRFDELCKPYATVVEIDRARLPRPEDVVGWSAEQFARSVRHDTRAPEFSSDIRQLMHVAFKVAAEMGEDFVRALEGAKESAGLLVTDNLFERHIRPLFIGD